MAYFAEIENGIVKRVIVADQEFIDSGKVGDSKTWVETSTDGSIRKNYAGIGYIYDKNLDAFIPPKPYTSWVLDKEKGQYKAPKDSPKDGKDYCWNESTKEWKEFKLS